MARPSTAAFLLLLLVSLLAVAHGNDLEADPATDAAGESTVVAVRDETGPPSPTLPADGGATADEVVVPVEHGILRLPSHRRHGHHPCRHGLLHRHLWWARHHGMFHDAHRFFHGHGEPVRDGEPREAAPEADESKPVVEPDPDRSLPDTDGDGGEAAAEAAVKAWRREMLWRRIRHGLRHHRHHRHEEEEDNHEQEEEGARGFKRFHHHHDEDDDEEEKQMRKRFHHHHHDDDDEEEKRKPFHHAAADSDSDNEDEEVEELVRRFRKAIMRRRFRHGHGRRFFHHHHHHHHHGHHRHAEEPEQEEDQGGVMAWIKSLMNRF
ncbi:hypothetical protein ACP70R_029345 [Stipagrostis hirtigluma subsp. patula]